MEPKLVPLVPGSFKQFKAHLLVLIRSIYTLKLIGLRLKTGALKTTSTEFMGWSPLFEASLYDHWSYILIILIHLEYGTPCWPAFQNESWDLGALWLARVPLFQKICLVSRKGILMIPVSGLQVRRHWPCTLMCLSCHRWTSWAEKWSRSAWSETTQPNLTISKLHPNALARRGHDWCHP